MKRTDLQNRNKTQKQNYGYQRGLGAGGVDKIEGGD